MQFIGMGKELGQLAAPCAGSAFCSLERSALLSAANPEVQLAQQRASKLCQATHNCMQWEKHKMVGIFEVKSIKRCISCKVEDWDVRRYCICGQWCTFCVPMCPLYVNNWIVWSQSFFFFPHVTLFCSVQGSVLWSAEVGYGGLKPPSPSCPPAKFLGAWFSNVDSRIFSLLWMNLIQLPLDDITDQKSGSGLLAHSIEHFGWKLSRGTVSHCVWRDLSNTTALVHVTRLCFCGANRMKAVTSAGKQVSLLVQERLTGSCFAFLIFLWVSHICMAWHNTKMMALFPLTAASCFFFLFLFD